MSNYVKNTTNILKWIDSIEKDTFVPGSGYSMHYFGGFPCISIDELNVLVTVVNSLLMLDKSLIRVDWGAGEIRPIDSPDRIYLIDEELESDLKLHLFVEIGIRR